jgi:hypothetical protein
MIATKQVQASVTRGKVVRKIILKVSKPRKIGGRSVTEKYNPQCSCSPAEQASRESLNELSRNVANFKNDRSVIKSDLKKKKSEVRALLNIDRNRRSSRETEELESLKILIKDLEASKIRNEEDILKSKNALKQAQSEIVPPTCNCWAAEVHESSIHFEWDDEEHAPFFIQEKTGEKIYEGYNGEFYFYNKRGEKVVTYPTIKYHVDPLLRKMKPCSWHGGLCIAEKRKLLADILLTDLQDVHKYAAPVNKKGKYINGSPPTYGVYVLVQNGDDVDVVCYDTCASELKAIVDQEKKLRNDEVKLIRNFMKTLKEDHTVNTKYKELNDFIKKKEVIEKRARSIQEQVENLKKEKVNDYEIAQLKTRIKNAETSLVNERNAAENVWEDRVRKVSRMNVKKEVKMPTFSEFLKMDIPEAKEGYNFELNNLLVALQTDEYDQEGIKQDIRDLWEMEHLNKRRSDREDFDIGPSGKFAFFQNVGEKQMKTLKKAQNVLHAKLAKIENDKENIPLLTSKLGSLNSRAQQLKKKIVDMSRNLTFEYKFFLEESKKISKLIYDDTFKTSGVEESVIIGDIDGVPTEEVFNELKSVLKTDIKRMEEKLKSVSKRITEMAKLTDSEPEELSELFTKWKNKQKKFGSYQIKKPKVEKKEEISTIFDEADFEDAEDIFKDQVIETIEIKAVIPSHKREDKQEVVETDDQPKSLNPNYVRRSIMKTDTNEQRRRNKKIVNSIAKPVKTEPVKKLVRRKFVPTDKPAPPVVASKASSKPGIVPPVKRRKASPKSGIVPPVVAPKASSKPGIAPPVKRRKASPKPGIVPPVTRVKPSPKSSIPPPVRRVKPSPRSRK